MSTVTDPIADFLARVRNAARAQKPEMFVPYSKIKAEIARILKEEGYISDYSVDTSGAHPRIKITNKIANRIERDHGLEAGQPPGFAPLCRRGGNSARARRNGHVDSFHSARHSVRTRSEESKTSAANCWLTSGKRDRKFMSRIGNKAVEIPDKVKVNIGDDGAVSVEGPKGKLQLDAAARASRAA